MSPNQNPEQIARAAIDAQLAASGWVVRAKDTLNFHAGAGQAVREYTTDTGPADYAEEIIENIEAGLANLRTVAASLAR
jgi:type I site-specific restriction endonuclease